METLILLAFFAPLLFLILLLVRHAWGIHRDAIDKTARTQQLEELDRSLVQGVLERDRHTCQSCGTNDQVGVDFRGATPDEGRTAGPDDLEARCTRCYLARWQRFQEVSPSPDE